MIMPANYSVIAENELSYVDGGAFSSTTLNTNLITIIGNTFQSAAINAFVGPLFGHGIYDDKGNFVRYDPTQTWVPGIGGQTWFKGIDFVKVEKGDIKGGLKTNMGEAVQLTSKITSLAAVVYGLGHVTVAPVAVSTMKF